MNGIISEILIVLALLVLNGFFAMAELAVVSAKRGRLQNEAARGSKGAKRALRIVENPTKFLSTTQLCITLVGIVAGAYGGATIAEEIAGNFSGVAYAEELSFTFVVIMITFLSVVIGELIPKRLALAAPEKLAVAVAPLMARFSALLSPFVRVLEVSTEALLSLLPLAGEDQQQVTEEDIKSLIDQGSAQGVIEGTEGQIVGKALRLGDRTASSLMTPRQDIEWIDINTPLPEVWQQVKDSSHSYFPVGDGSVENLLGVLSVKDAARLMLNPKKNLRDLLTDPLRIPTTSSALKVIEQFRQTHRHFAIVIDEYGGVDGLITTHDLAEALVGDLQDEGEEGPEYVRRYDGSLLVEASMEIHDLLALLEVADPDHEQSSEYHSVGGFVVGKLGHIPTSGESFTFLGHTFEVVDMDRNRVDKVLVSKIISSSDDE